MSENTFVYCGANTMDNFDNGFLDIGAWYQLPRATAGACLFLMQNYSSPRPINVGSGTDQVLAELAALMAGLIGFKGKIVWDGVHADGTPRKLMDVSCLAELGWLQKTQLCEGIWEAYRDFLVNG